MFPYQVQFRELSICNLFPPQTRPTRLFHYQSHVIRMKTVTCLLTAAFASVLLYNCTQTPATANAPSTPEAPTEAELVKRGEYLVTIMGCNDCHSPKIMTDHGPDLDTKLLMSGHPAEVPLAPIKDKEAVRTGQWIMMHPMVTAFAGPWGTSYAANLTPDDTGIGAWSYEQFKKAMTEGKYKGLDGGRMLLPPMPWQSFVKMEEADLKAVFAYLMSLPPVKNVVPVPVPATEL